MRRTRAAYAGLVALVGLERLAELAVSTRNGRAAFAAGGVESGQRHYPVMVALHTGLLAGCVAETYVLRRPFSPVVAAAALGATAAAQALRWWCIATLGRQWNTRVIVIPGASLVRRGPYRYLHHPNYVAVVAEGIALPLVHGAWMTASAFSVANAVLLRERLRVENRALGRT